MGSLLTWLFLKSNEPQCHLFSRQRKKNGGCGRNPQKIFGTTSFQSKENALFDINRTLLKEHFCSLAEKAGVQTRRTLPSCVSESVA